MGNNLENKEKIIIHENIVNRRVAIKYEAQAEGHCSDVEEDHTRRRTDGDSAYNHARRLLKSGQAAGNICCK